MADGQQAQFDGVNPVSGYTLFHGKDGKSYYLKGDNLSDDEVTARVQNLRSQQAEPPLTEQEAATGARANALARQNLQEAATAPYEQQQAELQRRKNLAMNLQNKNIAPLTSASMAYFPAASARMLVGSKIGSSAGGYAAGKISPDLEPYGELAGGFAGGLAGTVSGKGLRSSLARTFRDPATGKVLSPWEVAVNKVIPDPYATTAIPGKPIPAGTNYGQFLRQPSPFDVPGSAPAPLPSADEFYQNRGAENLAIMRNTAKFPQQEPALPSPFSGATSTAGPLMRGASGPSVNPESVVFGPSAVTRTASAATEPAVSVYPEPRTPLSEDRPGAMWSIPREELPTAAQRSQPGAVETMRNLGRPIVLTPRGAVGVTNPDFMAVRQSAYNPFSPTPEQVNESPFSPQLRQEVQEMVTPRNRSEIEQEALRRGDIQRLRDLAVNGTAEEKAYADKALEDLGIPKDITKRRPVGTR